MSGEGAYFSVDCSSGALQFFARLTTSTSLRTSLSSVLALALAACATGTEDRQGFGGDGGGGLADAGQGGGVADAGNPFPTRADATPGQPDAEPSPDAEPVIDEPDAEPIDNCTVTNINLLGNANLDSGQGGGWVESSAGGYDIVVLDDEPGVTAHSGGYVAWMSGYDDAVDSLAQTINVPADATSVSVRGVRWIATEEDASAVAFDVATLDIVTTGGTQLELVHEWSNQDDTSNWAAFNYQVSGDYQGDAIRVRVRTDTDDSFPTHFLFDTLDFRVTTCM